MVGTCTVVANTCVGAYEGKKDSQDIRAYHQAFDLELVPMQTFLTHYHLEGQQLLLAVCWDHLSQFLQDKRGAKDALANRTVGASKDIKKVGFHIGDVHACLGMGRAHFVLLSLHLQAQQHP